VGLFILGVIPARFHSTRFPGKPLAIISGKPMIQHVYERALKASAINKLIVATDNERIKDVVEGFGGNVVMTDSTLPSGTDRVAEVARGIDADIILNIQGDEPLVHPDMLNALSKPFFKDSKIVMTTLVSSIKSQDELDDPNVVKVVVNNKEEAIYFSRFPIPYPGKMGHDKKITGYLKHIGLYGYRKDFLMLLTSLPPSSLEISERLEQLRVIENGFKIKTVKVEANTIGVDKPEDIKKVETFLKKNPLHY